MAGVLWLQYLRMWYLRSTLGKLITQINLLQVLFIYPWPGTVCCPWKWIIDICCFSDCLQGEANEMMHLYCLNYCSAENTRASYPIEYIPNAKIPCVGPHPKNVILLACDAFGVLPPVSKLNLAQTMYHFISGYTALVCIARLHVTYFLYDKSSNTWK